MTKMLHAVGVDKAVCMKTSHTLGLCPLGFFHLQPFSLLVLIHMEDTRGIAFLTTIESLVFHPEMPPNLRSHMTDYFIIWERYLPRNPTVIVIIEDKMFVLVSVETSCEGFFYGSTSAMRAPANESFRLFCKKAL